MSSSPHEFERSLLQKAVRRGNEDLVEKVVNYLTVVGDQTWLKNRLVVMAYEECWMYAKELILDNKIMGQYKSLSRAVKNKNAAGLGALAVKNNTSDDLAIMTVARGLDNPVKFWEWVRSDDSHKQIIETAFSASKRSVSPDDKAMMFAAAYLAVKCPVPETQVIEPNSDPSFPYWIAIDKHTGRGREIYIEACKEIELDANKGMQLGFYLEGSLVNQLQDSPSREQLKLWQMNKLGFTLEQATEIWDELRPRIINKSRSTVERMIERIETKNSDQLDLFHI